MRLETLHTVASIITILTGLAGAVYYWQTHPAVAYGMFILFVVSLIWLNSVRREPMDFSGKSLPEIIRSLEAYAEVTHQTAEFNERASILRQLNAPELIGRHNLTIKEPKHYSHFLGNSITEAVAKLLLVSYLWERVFLRQMVGMTISLRSRLSSVPGKEVLCSTLAYGAFALLFLHLHTVVLDRHGPSSVSTTVGELLKMRGLISAVALPPTSLETHGQNLYLLLAIVWQLYGLVPFVYSVHGVSDARLLVRDLARLLTGHIGYFFIAFSLFTVSLLSGQISSEIKLGYEAGFFAVWSVTFLLGIRRLAYSVFMLILGGYIIAVISSIASC